MSSIAPAQSPPPNRDVRTPVFVAPPGSCDCHIHIIGPQRLYPLNPDAPVAFEDCTLEDYQAVQRTLGLERALIVMSVGHGYNYQHLLHILCAAPDAYRGVASLAPDVTDRELAILREAGVVGARFLPGQFPTAPEIDRLNAFGFSIHFLVRDKAALDRWATIVADHQDARFVIEHGGLPNPEQGVDSPHFRAILALADTGRAWIKLSPRFSREDYPWVDTVPFIGRLVEARPDRLLYGSDYPHPMLPGKRNEADFLDLMASWIPDVGIRDTILVANPAELFGFPPPRGGA